LIDRQKEKQLFESKVQMLWQACQDLLKQLHENERSRRLSIDSIKDIDNPIEQVDAYLGEYKGFVYRHSEEEVGKPLHFHSIEILKGSGEDIAKVIRDRMKDLSQFGWVETRKDHWEKKIR